MSDRIAVFNDGRIEQVGAAGRGLRAARERVRRRLRRRLEPARARRPALHGPAGEDPHARRRRAAAAGAHVEAGRDRDVAYVGMVTRYLVDARRGRRASGRPPEPGGRPRARRSRAKGRQVRLELAPGAGVGRRRTEGGSRMTERKTRSDAGRPGAAGRAALSCASPRAAAATTRARRARSRGLGTTLEEIQAIGEGEGEVNLVAWAGYVEDGSTIRTSTG